MARETSWRDLRLGLAALVVVVAAGAGVLRFARVGALRGDTIVLYAATPHARGVLPGSEVWLDGRKVGAVRGVGFRAPSADTVTRVLLTLEVLAEAIPLIGRDAPIDVRAGESLIGSPVVAITSGIGPTLGGAPVRAGDTLVTRQSRELDAVRAEFASATSEVPVIVGNLRVLAAQLGSARSTLGALGVEGAGDLAPTAEAASQLMRAVSSGSGTVGMMRQRGEPVTYARHAMALADSVRRLLDGNETSLGRLRRDSTLLGNVERVRRDLVRAQAALIEPRGSAGRMLHDAALRQELARTRAEMDALATDLRRNPLRYLSL